MAFIRVGSRELGAGSRESGAGVSLWSLILILYYKYYFSKDNKKKTKTPD